jgi:hypothetical protein
VRCPCGLRRNEASRGDVGLPPGPLRGPARSWLTTVRPMPNAGDRLSWSALCAEMRNPNGKKGSRRGTCGESGAGAGNHCNWRAARRPRAARHEPKDIASFGAPSPFGGILMPRVFGRRETSVRVTPVEWRNVINEKVDTVMTIESGGTSTSETADLRRAADLLCLWRLCGKASCRRYRTCRGRAHVCAKSNSVLCPLRCANSSRPFWRRNVPASLSTSSGLTWSSARKPRRSSPGAGRRQRLHRSGTISRDSARLGDSLHQYLCARRGQRHMRRLRPHPCRDRRLGGDE